MRKKPPVHPRRATAQSPRSPVRRGLKSRVPAQPETTTASSTLRQKIIVIGAPSLAMLAILIVGAFVVPGMLSDEKLDKQIANMPRERRDAILGEETANRHRVAEELVAAAVEKVAHRTEALRFTEPGVLESRLKVTQNKLTKDQGLLTKRLGAEGLGENHPLVERARKNIAQDKILIEYYREKLRQFNAGALDGKYAKNNLKQGQRELKLRKKELATIEEDIRELAREYVRAHPEEIANLKTPRERYDEALAVTDAARAALETLRAREVALRRRDFDNADVDPAEFARLRESIFWANEDFLQKKKVSDAAKAVLRRK